MLSEYLGYTVRLLAGPACGSVGKRAMMKVRSSGRQQHEEEAAGRGFEPRACGN